MVYFQHTPLMMKIVRNAFPTNGVFSKSTNNGVTCHKCFPIKERISKKLPLLVELSQMFPILKSTCIVEGGAITLCTCNTRQTYYPFSSITLYDMRKSCFNLKY